MAASRRRALGALAAIGLALATAGCGINDIPTLEEKAKADWAQVQNQYQRRADLIPNLETVVNNAANFERSTLEAVVAARAKVGQMQLPADLLTNKQAFEAFQQNQGALTSALSRLLVVVEQYPDLKSNQNFLALQSQLEGTENRIAVARRDYIEAVRRYNTELRTFPGVIWAATVHRSAEPMQTFAVASDRGDLSRPPTIKAN